MNMKKVCARILVLALLSATSAAAGEAMSLLGERSADTAAKPPAEKECRPSTMSGDLRIGGLSGVSIEDVSDRAKALGVNIDIEKLGGLFIKQYHFQAEGCTEALKKFWAYLDRLSDR